MSMGSTEARNDSEVVGRSERRTKKSLMCSQNWDDIYDPSRPNNYEDYKHSNEKITEIREWKNKLYAHRMARRRDSDSDSSSDHRRPQMNSMFPSRSAYRS